MLHNFWFTNSTSHTFHRYSQICVQNTFHIPTHNQHTVYTVLLLHASIFLNCASCTENGKNRPSVPAQDSGHNMNFNQRYLTPYRYVLYFTKHTARALNVTTAGIVTEWPVLYPPHDYMTWRGMSWPVLTELHTIYCVENENWLIYIRSKVPEQPVTYIHCTYWTAAHINTLYLLNSRSHTYTVPTEQPLT